MKHFPAVLNDILKETELTQAELGNLSGIGQRKISNLVNGMIRADQDDFLALYSKQVPLDHDQKARLAFAHIQDELPTEAFKHLKITVPATALHEETEKGISHLSGRAQDALRYLLSLQDELPNLGDLIIEQAKLVGWKDQNTKARSKVLKYPGNKHDPIKRNPAGLSSTEKQ